MRVLLLVALATAACATAAPRSSSGTGPPAPAATHVYTTADVHFMNGMIGHHAQAVLMARWAPSHGGSPALQALCERIVVGQTDEIGLMQRWLRGRNETVPDGDPAHFMMPGMELMPGMLRPPQLAQLDAARGPEFDRLFLTFMIQHHQGAITMVQQLLAVPGAAQDGPIFRFASDVNVDQTTEINRMTLMLNDLKRSSQ